MDQAQIEKMGHMIAKLADRVAIGILMDATEDDYVNDLELEMEELSEAVAMLEMLNIRVPMMVRHVFTMHFQCVMDAMTKN